MMFFLNPSLPASQGEAPVNLRQMATITLLMVSERLLIIKIADHLIRKQFVQFWTGYKWVLLLGITLFLKKYIIVKMAKAAI